MGKQKKLKSIKESEFGIDELMSLKEIEIIIWNVSQFILKTKERKQLALVLYYNIQRRIQIKYFGN